MKKQSSIHELLNTWGSQSRTLPPHSEDMKRVVFARLGDLGEEKIHTGMQEAVHLPWLSFVFGGLAILVLVTHTTGVVNPPPVSDFASQARDGSSTVAPQESVNVPGKSSTVAYEESVSAPGKMGMPDYYPYPSPNQNPPITDNREFLRTDYNATLRTRNVRDATRRVEVAVRGFSGRIDNTSSSQKFGYVSFAVPASKFGAFKNEVESLVGSRFLTTNIYTENMLPQKQSIEEQQKQFEKMLSDVRAERQRLVAGHNQQVATIQARLNAVVAELAVLRAEQTNDPVRKAHIEKRIAELVSEQGILSARLVDENASYAKQLSSLDRRIQGTETGLEYTKTQDQKLLDTVATVRGTISVNWISLWEIMELYVSPYWVALALAAAAGISYFLDRRRVRSTLL